MWLALGTLFFICVYAAFQSVAGVGLLLFGTPTLILLGYSFAETLAVVVPTSLVISLLQLTGDTKVSVRDVQKFAVQTAPLLIVGLALVLVFGFENQLNFLIAAALAAAVSLQVFNLVRKSPLIIKANLDWALLGGIGFVHGLTNLGGGFLAAYSSLRNVDRVTTRTTIALGYSVFAVFQILVLIVFSSESFTSLTLYAMVLGAGVYQLLGKKLFASISEGLFKILMPVVTAFFSLSVLISGLSSI